MCCGNGIILVNYMDSSTQAGSPVGVSLYAGRLDCSYGACNTDDAGGWVRDVGVGVVRCDGEEETGSGGWARLSSAKLE